MKNLDTALELFHMARREQAIANKLYAAYDTHDKNVREIGNLLKAYATWQKSDLVLRDSELWLVVDVSFNGPDPDDTSITSMYPKFTYGIRNITGISVTEYDVDWILGGHRFIDSDGQKHYIRATPEQIDEIAKLLPKTRIKSVVGKGQRAKKG